MAIARVGCGAGIVLEVVTGCMMGKSFVCFIWGKEICDNMCVSVACISSKVLSLYYIDYTFGLASSA